MSHYKFPFGRLVFIYKFGKNFLPAVDGEKHFPSVQKVYRLVVDINILVRE